MPTTSHSGGCQCGAIRYKITGPIRKAGICHCRMCQKAFGSWGAPLANVLMEHVTWTRGKPGEFRSSSIVTRGFFRDCGTPLYMQENGDPTYEISIGSLDDPNAVMIVDQVGIESKVAWFDTMHTLPTQKTTDYRSPEDLKRLASLQHPDQDTEIWPPK